MKMKKVAMLAFCIAICLAGSTNLLAGSWVISKNGKMDCKSIRIGAAKTRLILQDGQKLVLPTEQIRQYYLNGRLYSKRFLYRDGNPCKQMVFMELVDYRDGLCLYRYFDKVVDPSHYSYYVYENGRFSYALDDSMEEQEICDQFRYFGIQAVIM
ncbi:MAG: hypothetical protein JXA72_12195 [Bacteroidales bacterium]|nr:hypothetical protein [Bacteroidales bacterium]